MGLARARCPAPSLLLLLLLALLALVLLAPSASADNDSNDEEQVLEIYTCADRLRGADRQSHQDGKNGFSAEFDVTCEVDPDDCFDKFCRVCKTTDNDETGPYRFCSDVASGKSARSGDLAVLPRYESGTHFTKAATGAMLEAAAQPTSAECAARVSSGDNGVGISAAFDRSCANGGVGCFGGDGCRFCRVIKTPQSGNFVPCSDIGASPSASSNCAAAVTASGLTDVAFVTDTLCQTNAKLAGCVGASSCRLCRNTKNERNQYLLNCKVLRERLQLAEASKTTTAITKTSADGESGKASAKADPGVDVATLGAGAVIGVVVALAVVMAHQTRARRIADAALGDGTELHRIDSIVQEIGRDRIAQI